MESINLTLIRVILKQKSYIIILFILKVGWSKACSRSIHLAMYMIHNLPSHFIDFYKHNLR